MGEGEMGLAAKTLEGRGAGCAEGEGTEASQEAGGASAANLCYAVERGFNLSPLLLLHIRLDNRAYDIVLLIPAGRPPSGRSRG